MIGVALTSKSAKKSSSFLVVEDPWFMEFVFGWQKGWARSARRARLLVVARKSTASSQPLDPIELRERNFLLPTQPAAKLDSGPTTPCDR
jgi:hypothetical protein